MNRFIGLELWFTMEKLWYYGKNYGTIPKTMELWISMKKLWYYGKNYDTIINYSKLKFTIVFGGGGTRDTQTYRRAFSSVAVTTCFNDLDLLRLGFEHPISCFGANALTDCATARRTERKTESHGKICSKIYMYCTIHIYSIFCKNPPFFALSIW